MPLGKSQKIDYFPKVANPLKTLLRYPVRKNDPLQAWDTADQLLLEYVGNIDLSGKRILILNDQFGALIAGLEGHDTSSYTDSYVSDRGIHLNCAGKKPISNLDDLDGIYDLVLLKVPKNMSFFEDILCHLTHHLRPSSKVICGAMIKHLPKTSFELLQKYIGETSTSLAQKKARLIFADFQKGPIQSPFPLKMFIEPLKSDFVNHSNLFSREKLDIGTRFFLEHIPVGKFQSILDLGCANGVVGILAKKLNPHAKVIFSDESNMAVQSAKINYQNHFSDEAKYLWTNCYEGQERESLDLVLCNPPFHQQNTVGDFIAEQMFQDSHQALKKGALIRVIGNSHLGYQRTLKKIFGNSEIVATNQKFMIIDARKI